MKVKDLQGKLHNWNLGQYVNKKSSNCSELHSKVRDFLAREYPSLQILEEVFLPGDKLYLDFFIPQLKLSIECMGLQHDNYTPFFHGNNKLSFYKAKARDKRKQEFCRINDVSLIYFYPFETIEDWRAKLC